jgi:hypothetical protein
MFALAKGCDRIVVPKPIGAMKNILPYYGFQLNDEQINIPIEMMGNSIGESQIGDDLAIIYLTYKRHSLMKHL